MLTKLVLIVVGSILASGIGLGVGAEMSSAAGAASAAGASGAGRASGPSGPSGGATGVTRTVGAVGTAGPAGAVGAAGPAGAAGDNLSAPAGGTPHAGFGWPLPGFPTVLRPFDPPDHPYGPGHRGVDLGGWDGEPVLAAGAGVVAFAGTVAGKPVVSVDHPNGLRTTYEPVMATVSAGQHVIRGQTIGTLQAGHDGCLAAACLHWGVRRGEEYLDPLWLLVSSIGVRLLPCDASCDPWRATGRR